METVTQFTFTDLLRRPREVAAAADSARSLVIHRRGAPDLMLSRVDRFRGEVEDAAAFARLLRAVAAQLPADQLAAAVADALPWTRYLTAEGRAEFVTELASTLQACVDLDTFGPLGQLVREWQATAAIQADPALTAVLTAPVTELDGRPALTPG